MKFYDIPLEIKTLEFDGDKTDLRLHSTEQIYWGADNEISYNKATEAIDKISYKGKGWRLFAWYDISGFNYWMENMREPNYIQLSIYFEKEDISPKSIKAIKTSIDKAIDRAYDIARYNNHLAQPLFNKPSKY